MSPRESRSAGQDSGITLRESRAARLDNSMAPRTSCAVGQHEWGPFYRNGWLREKNDGVCAHTRMDDVDGYYACHRNFSAYNTPLPDDYASNTALVVRYRPNSNKACSSRILVTNAGESDEAWTRDADRLPFFRFKNFVFPYNAHCDTAIHLDRVQSRNREKKISKLAHRRNSRAYDANLSLYDQIIAKHRAQPLGHFRHLNSKGRRTARRKCRRAMARKGAEQITIFCQRIRGITEEYPIDFCDFSPLEDYVDGMRKETSNNFRTWLFSVSCIEFDMDRT